MQNSVSKNLSERFYPISQRVHRQPAAKKLVRRKKKTPPKVQRQNSRTVFKKNNLEVTKTSPFVAKRIIAQENKFPLSFLIICLEMEQFVPLPLSVYNSSNNSTIVTKQELPKYKPEQTPTYHKDTLEKENNQQLNTSASPLVNTNRWVSSHQAIKVQHFDSWWNRDWCAVEGLCTALEAQKRTRTRHLPYLTWRSQHDSRPCCQQSCQG